ncbi:MAG: DUF1292 domain-containing protein [Eubacteriales bacterium]|nr:DUF1292 domain-containing protein [Eubacteriales bacterium]
MKDFPTIPFFTEDGEEIELAILEQTRINGVNYLLVSACEGEDWDEESEEAYVFILKESDSTDSEESTYEEVLDDEELISVSKIFEQLMEDMDFEVE